MTRFTDRKRRPSTQIRDNRVHEIYRYTVNELGGLRNVVSKSYIYERIKQKTGLCSKTIAFILNHTIPTKF